MKKFEGKKVVITGAASGIGKALAREFASKGSRLILNDFDSSGLQTVKEELGEACVFTRAFDVGDKRAMYQFAADVYTALGPVHAMVNNAGVEGSTLPAYSTSAEEFERVMQVNYFGVLYGSLAFLPHMVENKEGALINISSIFGLVGMPSNADYCSAKFAVRGLTESLMAEFQESPVCIHCVHPGGINTNIAQKENSQDFAKKYLNTAPAAIAAHIVKKVAAEKAKIVYGSDSAKVWFASNFIPQQWLKKILWKESKALINHKDYQAFLKP